MKEKNEVLFCSMPIPKAILVLAVPTVISQIITIIYNMADTFFIGQLGEPRQVAAATLNMPLFMFMTALSNLFGVGGSSLISRFLGANEHKKHLIAAHSVFGQPLYLPFYMVFLCSCSVLSLCQFLAQMKKLFPLPLPTCSGQSVSVLYPPF